MKNVKNKILKLVAVLLLFIFGFLVYEIFFSNEQVVVKTETIQSGKISKNYRLTVAVISDLHYGKYMNKQRFEKFIQKLNSQNPDVVLFLGDIFDTATPIKENELDITKLFNSIEAKKGKFYILGDKDQPDKIIPIMENTYFELLDNKSTKLYQQNEYIQLIGLNPKYHNDAFKDLNTMAFALVMSHYPSHVENIPNQLVDLMVAGHTLGNQVNIPIFSSLKGSSQDKGYISGMYQVPNKTNLYVNNGLGTIKNDIRLFAPPEITLFTIEGTK